MNQHPHSLYHCHGTLSISRHCHHIGAFYLLAAGSLPAHLRRRLFHSSITIVAPACPSSLSIPFPTAYLRLHPSLYHLRYPSTPSRSSKTIYPLATGRAIHPSPLELVPEAQGYEPVRGRVSVAMRVASGMGEPEDEPRGQCIWCGDDRCRCRW